MRPPYIVFSFISLLLITSLALLPKIALATTSLDLLALPAQQSALASQSIITALTPNNNSVLAVGERGHIINWQDKNSWQQQESPVSVTITGVTILSDGSKIAVGHDGVILKVNNNSSQWRKVFTGVELTTLKIAQLKQQYETLQLLIETTQDEDLLEDLTYQLDDLSFAIEDNELELTSGPNKPLLSIARTSNDTLFATGAYGTLLISTDKGDTWQLVSDRLENPDSYHLNSVISTENDHLYIVGENGVGFQSNDIGKSWAVMELPYTGSFFGIIAFTPSNKNPTELTQPTTDTKESTNNNNTQLVAFGLQGHYMVSLDGGTHWQHDVLPTKTSILGGDFSQQGIAYLVGHGGVIATVDPKNLTSLTIKKHASGAAFSSVLVKENTLILAGQFGISQWLIKE